VFPDRSIVSPLAGIQNALIGIDHSRVANIDSNETYDSPANNQNVRSSPGGVRKKLIAEVKPLPKQAPSVTPSNVAVVNPTVITSGASVPAISVTSSQPLLSESSGASGSGEPTATIPAPRPSPTRDDRIGKLESRLFMYRWQVNNLQNCPERLCHDELAISVLKICCGVSRCNA